MAGRNDRAQPGLVFARPVYFRGQQQSASPHPAESFQTLRTRQCGGPVAAHLRAVSIDPTSGCCPVLLVEKDAPVARLSQEWTDERLLDVPTPELAG